MKEALNIIISTCCAGAGVMFFLLDSSMFPAWLSAIVITGFIANLFLLWDSKEDRDGATFIMFLADLFFAYTIWNETLTHPLTKQQVAVFLGFNGYLLFLNVFKGLEEIQPEPKKTARSKRRRPFVRVLLFLFILSQALPPLMKEEPLIVDSVQTTTTAPVSVDQILQDTPRSTCFKQVGYDAQSQTLYLVFRTTGAMYRYTGFPQEAWDSFINDSSLGGHFNRQIKGKYSYVRVR